MTHRHNISRPEEHRRTTAGLAIGVLVAAGVVLARTPARDADGGFRPDLRVATFNASLNRRRAGQLAEDLSSPDDAQARAVARIVQHVRPDIILINEFDYDEDGRALRRFQRNYLAVAQEGEAPLDYPHAFVAPVNTGVATSLDLDNDGRTDGPGDAQGYGTFPGQYGMVVLSRHPVIESRVRTFRRFLWRDMPGALLPDDAETAAPADWFGPTEQEAVRLSSKSHWDIPVQVGNHVVHVLASHPTPPVFDGPEDRNGRRNHDEIRFWADYIDTDPDRGAYIVDDAGVRGGLPPESLFVIVGDLNADPHDGDGVPGAAAQLLQHERVSNALTPGSPGGIEQATRQAGVNLDHRGAARFDTSDFNDATGPGNLRIDYALPCRALTMVAAGVLWPRTTDASFGLVSGSTSGRRVDFDHRLVWIDLAWPARALPRGVLVTDVTMRSATLRVTTGAAGPVRLECDPDASFSNALVRNATAGARSRSVAVTVDGLRPETTYYFRVHDAAGSLASGSYRTRPARGAATPR
ncbi:MAG: endonuclease/exonuclease/phosphatase family protein [Planctomycetota bacterium]|jgi:endonuclease/exonuclease/phosphatase family metal-dependent hydrolase